MGISSFPANTGFDLTKLKKTESLYVNSTSLTTGVAVEVFSLSGFKGKVKGFNFQCVGGNATSFRVELKITIDDEVIFRGSLAYSSSSTSIVRYFILIPEMAGGTSATYHWRNTVSNNQVLYSTNVNTAIISPTNVTDGSVIDGGYAISPNVGATWINSPNLFVFKENIKFEITSISGGASPDVTGTLVYETE